MSLKVGEFLYHVLDANQGVYYEVTDKNIFLKYADELKEVNKDDYYQKHYIGLSSESYILLKKCDPEKKDKRYLECKNYSSKELIELFNSTTLKDKYFIWIHVRELDRVYFKDKSKVSMIESVAFDNKLLLVMPKEYKDKPYYGKCRKPVSTGYAVQYTFIPSASVDSKLVDFSLFEISLFGLKQGLKYERRVENKATGEIEYDVITEKEKWLIESKEKIFLNSSISDFKVQTKYHLNSILNDIERYRLQAIENTLAGISEFDRSHIESKFKKSIKAWVTEQVDERLNDYKITSNF